MRFSLLTLFPDAIRPYAESSLLGRAQKNGLIHFDWVDPREFTTSPHRRVDDTPYGGGSGMVLQVQPFEDAYNSLQPLAEPALPILLGPAGKRFDQAMAQQLAQNYQQLVFFCGHYEGFDARLEAVIPGLCEISVGDYVMTGGELAAMTMIDAISRYLPGVVKEASSVVNDSFSGETPLLDTPHYTRPPVYKGHEVPPVLLSGDHQAIAAWRHQQAMARTQARRPDLLMKQPPDA